MNTSVSATTFHVSDLAVFLKYDMEVLGFAENFQFGAYAGVKLGPVEIHLSEPRATNKKAVGQESTYCDDVDGYYAEVTERVLERRPPQKITSMACEILWSKTPTPISSPLVKSCVRRCPA